MVIIVASHISNNEIYLAYGNENKIMKNIWYQIK